MNRREILTTALLGGAAALAGCEGPQPRTPEPGRGPAVHTGRTVRWRMASSFPRSLDTLFGGAERVARRVAEMTDGQFEIRVYPAGELVPSLQVLDAVQQGTLECGQTASYYYIGKNPALAFDACVPFDMTARQKTAWLLEGGGLELLNRRFADFGVLTLPAGNTGVQMGGWFRREVGSAADLAGLRMRIPGLGGEVMARLGVAVQNIPGGEIYTALEMGAIDASEWVGPYDDEHLGFHKVVKNYYYPGFWEPGPNLSVYVNARAWGLLPAAWQEVFRAACTETVTWMLARYDALNPPALARVRAAGVVVRPFPDEVLVQAREATAAILEEHAAADAGYREVYEHWRAFRDAQAGWGALAELGYAGFQARG